MKSTSIVIISDIHLRSENCQAKLLLSTLREYDYETLIINGDLIEDDRIHPDNVKMNWQQFQFIEYMRSRLKKKIPLSKLLELVEITIFLETILSIRFWVLKLFWNIDGKWMEKSFV